MKTSMDPFGKKNVELVSKLQGAWKVPITLSVNPVFILLLHVHDNFHGFF